VAGAVIYEIAPISFQDTNVGKGDLRGIESRIGYLEWLGIDAVWLTPFYPSPMLDFGYDISDYCAVTRSSAALIISTVWSRHCTARTSG
jgi:glycosidase